MEKTKAKEKIKYVEKLAVDARNRYREKLKLLNGFDPYDSTDEWGCDVSVIPPLNFPELMSYLVCGVSAYTLEQFRCFKSLDAHMQFTDGWVHDLQIYTPPDCENTVIRAKVNHSMRTSEKPLLPWVVLEESGTVLAAHCDCMAGLAETCTHVGALLFKMEAMVRIREKTTVTGVPAYWIVPPNIDKVRPEPGYQTDYTSSAARKFFFDSALNSNTVQDTPPQTKRTCTVSTAGTTPQPTLEAMSQFLVDLHNTGDKAVILCAVQEFSKEFADPVPPIVLPKSLIQLRDTNFDHKTRPELLAHCEKTFTELSTSLTMDIASKIERETREQHKSPVWFSVRAGRITASQLHSVCIFNVNKPALSTIRKVCYPTKSKLSIPAVEWGVRNEDYVRNLYRMEVKKRHCNFTVDKCGLIIDPTVPYMGASPDGLINCDCCGKGTLEIKCPFKYKDVTVEQASQNSDFCLEDDQGQLKLRRNHKYYFQVQCQMAVTNCDYCDFVVWTTCDCVVVRVELDVAFIYSCHEKAEQFFKTIVLPELVAKTFTAKANDEGSPDQLRKRSSCAELQNSSTLPLKVAKHGPSTGNTGCNSDNSLGKGKKGRRKKDVWCVCHRSADVEDMVACDNPSCTLVWYHMSCAGLDQLPDEKEEWYCTKCLSKRT